MNVPPKDAIFQCYVCLKENVWAPNDLHILLKALGIVNLMNSFSQKYIVIAAWQGTKPYSVFFFFFFFFFVEEECVSSLACITRTLK